jgi:hypothetical protein
VAAEDTFASITATFNVTNSMLLGLNPDLGGIESVISGMHIRVYHPFPSPPPVNPNAPHTVEQQTLEYVTGSHEYFPHRGLQLRGIFGPLLFPSLVMTCGKSRSNAKLITTLFVRSIHLSTATNSR